MRRRQLDCQLAALKISFKVRMTLKLESVCEVQVRDHLLQCPLGKNLKLYSSVGGELVQGETGWIVPLVTSRLPGLSHRNMAVYQTRRQIIRALATKTVNIGEMTTRITGHCAITNLLFSRLHIIELYRSKGQVRKNECLLINIILSVQ